MSNVAQLGSFGDTSGSSLMFRNKLINGDMRIDQRNGGASQAITTSSIVYTVDRFFAFATGASVTGQRIAGTGSYPYVYRLTGAASNTQCFLIQRIEASNVEYLVGKTVTLQFEASATGGVTSLDYDIRVPSVRDNFNTTASVLSGTVTISSTPTIFSVTCTLPANAANGVQINIGKTSGLVAAQTFSISGVQLEPGSVATPFEQRPVGLELSLCQRYYEFGKASHATATTTGISWGMPIVFKIPKRALPIVSTTQINSNIGVTGEVNVLVNEYSFAYFLTSNATGTGQVQLSYTANSEL